VALGNDTLGCGDSKEKKERGVFRQGSAGMLESKVKVLKPVRDRIILLIEKTLHELKQTTRACAKRKREKGVSRNVYERSAVEKGRGNGGWVSRNIRRMGKWEKKR